MRCSNCKRSCEVMTEDQGYGAGEFWGTKYNDVRLVDVSDCCDASIESRPAIDSETLREFREAELGEFGEDLSWMTDKQIEFVDQLYLAAERVGVEHVCRITPEELVDRFYVEGDSFAWGKARDILMPSVKVEVAS